MAEGKSTPFDARLTEPGSVQILFKNVRNAIGVMQNDRQSEALEILRALVETYQYARTNIV